MTEAERVREPGFYWAKSGKEWIVYEFDGELWTMTGCDEGFRSPPTTIGPRIEPPQEEAHER